MRLLQLFKSGVAMIMAAATVSCAGDNEPFPVPEKPILEMDYTAEKTTFEVWAPTAEGVVVRLYDGDTLSEEIAMERAEAGLWRAVAEGDHKGEYYAFAVTVDGKQLKETAGIFARALNVNGDRGAIIDLRDTDPEGWAEDKAPEVKPSEIVFKKMQSLICKKWV